MTKEPKAKASAIAQSKPSPLASIFFFCSKVRASLLLTVKPSGTSVNFAPMERRVSSSMAVWPRRSSPWATVMPSHLPSSQSALFGL